MILRPNSSDMSVHVEKLFVEAVFIPGKPQNNDAKKMRDNPGATDLSYACIKDVRSIGKETVTVARTAITDKFLKPATAAKPTYKGSVSGHKEEISWATSMSWMSTTHRFIHPSRIEI